MSQSITIELPELIFQQLTRIANLTHQPLEALITQSILSNLPPTPDNAPPELQPHLLALQTLSSDALQTIAQATISPQQHDRHAYLLTKNETDQLTIEERQELTALREAADQLMLQKAYAWSILRWRGQKIPTLNEL